MAVERNASAAAAAEAEQIARLAEACRKGSSDEEDEAEACQTCHGTGKVKGRIYGLKDCPDCTGGGGQPVGKKDAPPPANGKKADEEKGAFQDCEGDCPGDEGQDAQPGANDECLKLPVAEPTELEIETKPKEDPPGLVLAKKGWDADLEALRALIFDTAIADSDKIDKIHDSINQRIEDIRGLDEDRVVSKRRLEDAGKERDRCRQERERTVTNKTKLEGDCRELQQQKSSISKENKRIAEEEQSRHSELKEKFEQAIKDVQEKMDAELEVRQHFLKENEELRGKLQKFTETYEAQEEQLAAQRETRGREMETAQQRLLEHETMCKESKVKSASLEKENLTLRKSEAVLRAELQTILGKFDEFHEAITGSNTRHGDCKTEIDTLQTQLQEFEKENTDLRANTLVNQLTKEQEVAQKQRDALEKLCDNLQRERQELHETLRKLKG